MLIRGQEGYIQSEKLNVLNNQDSSTYNLSLITPVPIFTESTFKEETTPELSPKATVEETPLPIHDADEIIDETTSAEQMINLFAYTNANVHVRSGPSRRTERVKSITKDTYVYLIENVKNDEGEIWSHSAC